MAKLYNLARMTTATTGTGTITLGSAVSGFLTFAQAGVSNGDVVSYGITDGANSEVGTGTYTTAGTTLTRTVTKSTNSNSAINLSGTAQVFITARAEELPTAIPITFAEGGTSDTGTAPVSFTPTVNFTGGTGTSSAGSTGVYKQLAAKVYYVQYALSIAYTVVPTSFSVTLPNSFTTAATGGLFGQNTTTGAIVQARATASSTTAGNVIDYTGAIAVTGTGQTVILSGTLTNT